MKLSTVIITSIAICAFAASSAQGRKIYNQIDLPQYSNVPKGMWVDNVCATSTSTHVNVNHLRWTLRRNDSHLKLIPGTPANCRRYYAPANSFGWERITVTYRFHGDTFVGQTQFYITNPIRP